MGKKKEKDLEHATATWEKQQVQAAALLAEIEKSAEVIDGHRAELIGVRCDRDGLIGATAT
jgi:hypothetical protein